MAAPNRQDWASVGEWAVAFSKEWEDARSEKSQGQDFIRAFLSVFGQTESVGHFEYPVKTPYGRTNYMDFHWPGKIAIEMKSRGRRLGDAFAQLGRYMACLPEGEEPPNLWMVSDFEHIYLYDDSTKQETHFQARKLRKHLGPFGALAGLEAEPIRGDRGAADAKATAKMNRLFQALKEHRYTGRELEVYLARLLFCLFADDTGIFTQDAFYNYVLGSRANGSDLADRLGRLFQALDRPEAERVANPFLTDKTRQSDFRHVNGDLFKEKLDTATFDRKMRETLLDCLGFDWSKINPAIFGSMFQGIMDGGDRREIGAHYTTEENILKLIDPLFMDSLRAEFKKAKKKNSPKALAGFHEKLAGLRFLDPACGCGNFLIIAYRELRQLELEVVREEMRLKGNGHQLLNIETHFLVNVDQFYGIEILSWPCQIARTGMWLVDHLCNVEASEEFGRHFARIPLEKGAGIVCANAHRIDWEDLVPKNELSYIMGNPPFVGARWMRGTQKEDMGLTFGALKGIGNIDYVTAWYRKATDMIEGTDIRAAFVSTNSITQGEQVAILWKPLMGRGVCINFGVPSFKWTSEAPGKAAVHCVIIGFSFEKTRPEMNPYLVEAPTVFIESRNAPICDVPEMMFGSMPNDGGNLIIEERDYKEFIAAEPGARPYIRRFMMGDEFINNKKRWCLWLPGIEPAVLRKLPLLMERVEGCKKYRLASSRETTKRLADTHTLFGEIRQPGAKYLALPKVSSDRRPYIPIGFLGKNVVAGDKLFTVPRADMYHFGVLTSHTHMAWMRAVCGRIGMGYSYSNTIVYNNFPWPDATEKRKAQIGELAQGILDARKLFPNSSFADLYDPLSMPPALLRAHKALDRAVMKLYGFPKDATEPEIVAELMARYQALADGLGE